MGREFWRLPEYDDRRLVGGVCGGLAYFLGVPIWLVRLVWAMVFFGGGVGFVIYMLLWIFLPEWTRTPDDFQEVTGD